MQYSFAHTLAMVMLLLLSELLHQSGDKPASLAKKLHEKGVRQPQLSRYLNGETKEPKRSTLLPIAQYYGISVEAFFDETLASKVLDQINSGEFVVQHRTKRRRAIGSAAPQLHTHTRATEVENAVDVLAACINEMADPQMRELIALQLQTLARAPDSAKARQGVLDALGARNTADVTPTMPKIGGIAGAVLDKKLTAESRQVFTGDEKTDA